MSIYVYFMSINLLWVWLDKLNMRSKDLVDPILV